MGFLLGGLVGAVGTTVALGRVSLRPHGFLVERLRSRLFPWRRPQVDQSDPRAVREHRLVVSHLITQHADQLAGVDTVLRERLRTFERQGR